MSKKDKKKKVLLTGGHAATTAIATIEEIIRRNQKNAYEIFWVGTEKAIEGKNIQTLESVAIPKLGVKYHSVISGRIQTKFSIWTIPSMVKVPLGFVNALVVVAKIKPDIIVSFGGHASFPVVLVGSMLKIPTILHEQTVTVGRANKLASFFADTVAVARKESIAFFPKEKCVYVGNPVMSQILEVGAKSSLSKIPVIYVTGGSRGAAAINNLVEQILSKLLKSFFVIHHTGTDQYEKFQQIKNNLPAALKTRYEPYPMIDPMKIDNVFSQADIIVSRAGANTVAEIIATKRPAILIPLPIAYLDEQKKNALFAKNFGIASVLTQEKTSPEILYKEIFSKVKNWDEIVARVKNKKSPDLNAASKLVDLIERNLTCCR